MSSEIYIEIFETQSALVIMNGQTYYYKVCYREEPCVLIKDEENTLRETLVLQKEGILS